VTLQADSTEPKAPVLAAPPPSKTAPQVDAKVLIVAPAQWPILTHAEEARAVGIVALFLSSVAICAATLFHLYWVTMAVAGVAVFCAIVSLVAGPKTRGIPKAPLYALLLSLAIVALTTL